MPANVIATMSSRQRPPNNMTPRVIVTDVIIAEARRRVVTPRAPHNATSVNRSLTIIERAKGARQLLELSVLVLSALLHPSLSLCWALRRSNSFVSAIVFNYQKLGDSIHRATSDNFLILSSFRRSISCKI